ncbi:MAG TPA: Hsp70 family protein [Bryobacteraceae bacterium]|nr:Hsp70 family protein [Bryobacteraceae bacterium]
MNSKPASKPATPRYSIGIDLGTTNCALAFTELADETASVQLVRIPQLVNANEVAPEALLPSFLYIPGESDFPKGSTALPWDDNPRYVTGHLAQRRGAEISNRLVSSAKSWLSYSSVDRTAAMLPWKAGEGVTHISPVDASAEYLKHLRAAWDIEHPDAPFDRQDVLVTVPASFDAIARELTGKAAEAAGFRNLTMLEEPQAAFYAWIERHSDWRRRVAKGDLVLVIDIGGGTTDFTLIAVTEKSGELQLERVAVGDHILLGGDNIDLALAHTVAGDLAAKGQKVDGFQLQALWNNCRLAKEKLLAPDSKADEVPVTILGKGSKVIGGTIKASLRRDRIEQVLEGFLPVVRSTDLPERARRAGLQEMGLPYASDPAITRHLARFLRQQAAASEHDSVRRGPSGLACPTHVLFNGGVLHAQFVRDRILAVLNNWLADEGFSPVAPLSGEDLMHSVARGSAYYGRARQGKGVRIRGGIARSYYVGIETAAPAVPGIAAPIKALAVAQFGMEEGTAARIPDREFGLVVDEAAEFRFFCSASRKNDPPGALIEDFGNDLEELSPVEVRLTSETGSADIVPVSFETVITETGTLQLWCVARDGRRWKLEFNVRETVTG